jgi:type I restriction enzyme S subunit
VIGRKGTVGSLYYEKQDYFPIDTTYYIEKSDKYDLKYIFYLLNTLNLNKMNTHSAVPGLNRENLYSLIAKVPEKKYQIKISEFLQQLDSKIELNNQIISNLEELASTLFKRWFVDFEFPDENGNPYKSSGGKMVDSELGEIPESWEVNKIGNMDIVVSDHVANGSFKSLKENVKILEDKSYALFLRNVDLKAELRGTLRYIDKASYDFLKKTHLFGGEVIISNVGDVGTVHLVPKNDKKMVLGNNQIYLNSKIENMNTYLYLFFKSVKGQELIKSITSGSVQMKFNKTDFRNLKIVFPLLDNFNIFSELLGNIRVKKNENNILRDTRDSLLPKLLSGEIELPEDEEV